jgi:hypothetical protein
MALPNPNQRSAAAAYDAFSIATSDSVDLTTAVRGFMVTVPGNVQITSLSGSTVVIPCASGVVYSIGALRVWATNTTATGIVGLI